MFRKIVLFLFMGLIFPAALTAEESKVIPLTNGELEKWRDPKEGKRWDFVVEFYKKNKAVGVLFDPFGLPGARDLLSAQLSVISELA